MNEWHKLDPTVLNLKQQREIRGVLINVLVSPYDVPLETRGFYDDHKNRFIIEFKYMDNEDIRSSQIDEHVIALVGKNSDRLYGFEIDVKGLKAQRVELRLGVPKILENAFESLIKLHKDRESNYALARSVIASSSEKFLENVQ